MTRLLNANFARLWKTKSFWVCLILAFGVGLANFLTSYSVQPECAERLGANMLSNSSNIMFFASIFAALFLGTDHSDGTIRNKLIVGHKRHNIYLSNLITTAAGGLLIMTVSWTVVLITGLCLGGKIGMPAGELALKMLICIGAIIAISAIFTLLGTLLSSKSTIVTITLVSTFVLLIGAAVIESLLDQPEYVQSYEMTVNGEVVQTDPQPNPMYIGGVKREILKTVNDVLPSGQLMQMEMGLGRHAELMPLYSLGVLAAFTAVGASVFRKKDLK